MWFFFSGSNLDQQTTGAQRRDSRSGSGGVATSGELSTTAPGTGHHRKSASGQAGGHGAQRRESRSKESGAGVSLGGGGGPPQAQKSRKNTGIPTSASYERPVSAAAHHRGSTISEMAFQSTATIIANICRALTVRALLIAHSVLCIWAAAEHRDDNSVWAFALVAFCLVGEGIYAVFVRAGDEPRWCSPAISVYLLATMPSLWLLQSSMCDFIVSNTNDSTIGSHRPPLAFGLQPNPWTDSGHPGLLLPQVLAYSLFVVLLFARWLLPRIELSREELSQILLAYMAIMTDILEFLGLLNWVPVCAEPSLRTAVLSAFTLSLLQFTFILTASRSRKMRIAVATKILLSTNRPDIRQAFYDLDIWAVMISLACQDIPFLIVRLSVFAWFRDLRFGSLAFIGKNVLVILVQSYRVMVLLNDRYRNPEISARSLLDEKRQSMALPSGMSLQLSHKVSRAVQQQQQQQQANRETTALSVGGNNAS